MELRRIGPLSAAKIACVLYAAIGLIIGFFFSLAGLLGATLGATSGDDSGAALFGLLFGIGAVVVLPFFYGVLGFVSALVAAAVYNLVARFTGGVQLELEGSASPPEVR